MSVLESGPKSTDTLDRGLKMLDRGMSGVLGLVKGERDSEEERMERELEESCLISLFIFFITILLNIYDFLLNIIGS